jgi:hypothetical protein
MRAACVGEITRQTTTGLHSQAKAFCEVAMGQAGFCFGTGSHDPSSGVGPNLFPVDRGETPDASIRQYPAFDGCKNLVRKKSPDKAIGPASVDRTQIISRPDQAIDLARHDP